METIRFNADVIVTREGRQITQIITRQKNEIGAYSYVCVQTKDSAQLMLQKGDWDGYAMNAVNSQYFDN